MSYHAYEDEGYDIKDSGERQEFDGGAMRDTEEGKLDYSNLFVWFEPMGTRYVQHMTKGREKYPDPEPGVPNWSLFEATEENLHRTLRSLDRHYKAYRMGETDEDHAAAILFNLNLAEKIRAALEQEIDWDRFVDYTEEAEDMLDDPTFDEPVEVSPAEELHDALTPSAREFKSGDKVVLSDRRVFYRTFRGDAEVVDHDEQFLPEVVTIEDRHDYAERAYYIDESDCYIVEEQIDETVVVSADPFEAEEANVY